MKHPSLYFTVPVIDPDSTVACKGARFGKIMFILCTWYACEVILLYIHMYIHRKKNCIGYVIRHSLHTCHIGITNRSL